MARPDIETLRALDLILKNQDTIMSVLRDIQSLGSGSLLHPIIVVQNRKELQHRQDVTRFALERLGALCNEE